MVTKKDAYALRCDLLVETALELQREHAKISADFQRGWKKYRAVRRTNAEAAAALLLKILQKRELQESALSARLDRKWDAL